jgi:hypothetical protein
VVSDGVALSTNPADWYFAVTTAPDAEDYVAVAFTPIIYWLAARAAIDVHVYEALQASLPRWLFDEISEGYFAVHTGATLAEVQAELLSRGFNQNNDYTYFVTFGSEF